jgi:hypothetical protein
MGMEGKVQVGSGRSSEQIYLMIMTSVRIRIKHEKPLGRCLLPQAMEDQTHLSCLPHLHLQWDPVISTTMAARMELRGKGSPHPLLLRIRKCQEQPMK